jgi:hypothetical protein
MARTSPEPAAAGADDSASVPVVPWALYGGLALTTCSMLLIQQFLTRVFTILFNSGLAFLAISITFLGLGSAGVAVYVLPRVFLPRRIPALVPNLAVAYAIALVAGFWGIIAVDHATVAGESIVDASLREQVTRVLGSSLLVLPALFLVGLVISLLLRAHARRVNRLYGADLMGAGIGCLLVLPLMKIVGGDSGIFLIGALAASGAVLLAHAHGRSTTRLVAGVLTLVFAAGPWLNRERALIDVRSHSAPLKGVASWVREDREIARVWNELARLGIFETVDGSSLYVRIDSSCQTTIPSQAPEHQNAYVEGLDFERLPYVLDRHRRYLEIGAGGGRGMVLAKAQGAESITGVEINPGIVDSSLGGFPGYGVGPLVADPANRLIAAEGRSWTRQSDESFDTVTITFIQTGIASGSAAFALSEANLFTVEAFTEFLEHVDDGGMFYIYRQGGNEILRLVSMAREALRAHGVEDISGHVYVARNETNRSVMMISRAPFEQAEVARLDAACGELGVEILYSPSGVDAGKPVNPFPARVRDLRAAGDLDMRDVVRAYNQLAHSPEHESLERSYITCADPQAYLDDYIVDVRAPTDDRPYYFFFGINRLRDALLYFDLDGVGILGGTVILLFWMAAAFGVLVTLLIALPLLLRRGDGGPRGTGPAVIAYFSGLGLGYMAVQISFIQRFVLFLGHPVFAISVVLLAFLLCSGLGSMASDRLFASGRATFARVLALLVAVLLLYNWLLPAIFQSDLLALPVGPKILISIALILPLGFVMGLLFPQGIRLVDAAAPQLTPWAWGANSAASVLGSIFALVLAIHLGFQAVAVIGALTYVVLCLPSSAVLRRAAGRG